MTDVAAATEAPNPVTPTEGGQISNNNNNNDNNNNDTESSSLSSTSFPIFDQVKGYLESSELSYQINERRREEVGGGLLDDGNTIIISLTLTGNNSSYKTYIDMKKREQRVAVYVETPVKIPEHKRSEACEYLMRVVRTYIVGVHIYICVCVCLSGQVGQIAHGFGSMVNDPWHTSRAAFDPHLILFPLFLSISCSMIVVPAVFRKLSYFPVFWIQMDLLPLVIRLRSFACVFWIYHAIFFIFGFC